LSVYDRGMSAFSGSAGVTAASVAAAGYYSYNQHYPTAADLYASPSAVDQLDFTMLHHTDVSLSTNVSRCTRATLCYSAAVCLCLCMCLSVTSRCSIELFGWTELVFGMEASFDRSYTVFQGNSRIPKDRPKCHSLWNFFLNSGLRKFRHGISIVKVCYRLIAR